ncbi:MAG: type III-A CRISPR-associated protein Csm2 [Chloroflexota bacterium]
MSNIQTIMNNDSTGQELVTFAERTAQQLVANQLTRGQIRNIFTEVRKIESLWEVDQEKALRRLVMLKPKMDYQTARIPQVQRLKEVLSEAIDEVVKGKDTKEKDERFKRFMNLFEAILAYHRARGGRN